MLKKIPVLFMTMALMVSALSVNAFAAAPENATEPEGSGAVCVDYMMPGGIRPMAEVTENYSGMWVGTAAKGGNWYYGFLVGPGGTSDHKNYYVYSKLLTKGYQNRTSVKPGILSRTYTSGWKAKGTEAYISQFKALSGNHAYHDYK